MHLQKVLQAAKKLKIQYCLILKREFKNNE